LQDLRAENEKLKGDLAAADLRQLCMLSPGRMLVLDSPAPDDGVQSIHGPSRLSFIMSPRTPLASRVRRCGLANMLDKGRSSALVIYTFDVWRMLMYCRVQHDFGKHETLQCSLQHEHDLAIFHRALMEQQAFIRQLQAKVPRTLDKATCDESTLSELLDEGEQALNVAQQHVEELTLENAELQQHLRQAQEECAALNNLVEAGQHMQEQRQMECAPDRESRLFHELVTQQQPPPKPPTQRSAASERTLQILEIESCSPHERRCNSPCDIGAAALVESDKENVEIRNMEKSVNADRSISHSARKFPLTPNAARKRGVGGGVGGALTPLRKGRVLLQDSPR